MRLAARCSTDMTPQETVLYLRGWLHPQLAKWQEEDEQAFLAVREPFKARDDTWNFLQQARATLAQAEEILNRNQFVNGPPGHVEAMVRNVARAQQLVREAEVRHEAAYRACPDGPAEQAIAAVKAQRAAERGEEEIRSHIDRLHNADRELLDLTRHDQNLQRKKSRLKAELAAIRAEQRETVEREKALRVEWDAAAIAAGFPGRPTPDLPPLPTAQEPFNYRRGLYDRSLLPGINCTEEDVARREVFEASLGIRLR